MQALKVRESVVDLYDAFFVEKADILEKERFFTPKRTTAYALVIW